MFKFRLNIVKDINPFNNNTINFSFFILLLVSSVSSYGQGNIPPPTGTDSNTAEHNAILTIPEVALLDLEAASGTTVVLNPSVPTEAGMALSFPVVDSNIWLNYSSIVGSVSEPLRNIDVQISSGTVPAGTALMVMATSDSGNGDGLMGVPSSTIVLSNLNQNIITNIGSAYTGDGITKGHNLQYTLDLLSSTGSYGLLDFDFNETLVLTYTLSDN